ncbi:MAG: 50S ribosomal protein L21 [Candidatus Aminicenantes bacterium]|nr:MAG: 50S ribosomal protein L21 [Candidatus Aminicenantes bacterium]
MFAVIKTGGKQFRVQVGDILEVEKLDHDEGQKITFDNVLLIEDDKNTLIGTPVVEKAQVVAEVMENFKDKKVLVFKKKRRKQYRKTSGHRQLLTRVKIEKIVTGLEPPKKKVSATKKLKPEEELKKLEAEVVRKKPAAKKEEPKTAKPKKPAKKAEVKKVEAKKTEPKKSASPKPKTEPVQKTAPKKKTPAEKPAVKKVTAKVKKTTSKKEK